MRTSCECLVPRTEFYWPCSTRALQHASRACRLKLNHNDVMAWYTPKGTTHRASYSSFHFLMCSLQVVPTVSLDCYCWCVFCPTRQERNREHAKRSRIRKKFMLECLQEQLLAMRKQNMALRQVRSVYVLRNGNGSIPLGRAPARISIQNINPSSHSINPKYP